MSVIKVIPTHARHPAADVRVPMRKASHVGCRAWPRPGAGPRGRFEYGRGYAQQEPGFCRLRPLTLPRAPSSSLRSPAPIQVHGPETCDPGLRQKARINSLPVPSAGSSPPPPVGQTRRNLHCWPRDPDPLLANWNNGWTYPPGEDTLPPAGPSLNCLKPGRSASPTVQEPLNGKVIDGRHRQENTNQASGRL